MWYAVYISKECAEREMFRRGQQFRWRTSLSWQTTDNIAAFFFLTTLCLQQRFYTRLDLITQWSIHLFRRTLVQIHREIRKLKWQKKRVSVSTISYERNMLSVYTRRRILTFSKNKPAAAKLQNTKQRGRYRRFDRTGVWIKCETITLWLIGSELALLFIQVETQYL